MKKRNAFSVMAQLIVLVKPLAGFMVISVIMGILGNLFATGITVLGGYALLDILKESTLFSVKTAFVCMILFALLRGVLRYAEQACNHYIAFKILAIIRDKVFQVLRKLAPAKLEGKDRGNLISLITSDVELLEVFYAHTISPALIYFFYTILLLCFFSHYHIAYMALALFAYGTVGILVPLIISKLSGTTALEYRNASGNLSSFVLESLRGLDEILQYGLGNSRLKQMDQASDTLAAHEEKMKNDTAKNSVLSNTVILLLDLGMFLLAVSLNRKGLVSFEGTLIPVLALMGSFGPSMALAALSSTLQNTLASANRILDLLEEEPLVNDVEGKEITSFNGASVNEITFGYNDEVVLENVSLDIPKDTIIGIVGKSGSGKSTLLKLLMRFWIHQKGTITISDKNIDDINTTDLRDMESYVTQETHLFHDSIRNNLKIAKLDASDEEIVAACEKASIHDFIMELPDGYDTNVGELGDTLSSGEKQRIGLARAFLHDGDFLLLDEPTSNLDALNEAMILKSLRETREGKTILLVSHRESTMRIADTIYKMESGRMS